MGVWGKESHLPLRITAVGAVCVGLDEFPDGKPVRGFFGRDGDVPAHELVSLFNSTRKCGCSSMARGSIKSLMPFISCCILPLGDSAMNRCTRWLAFAPSPTADATRFTLPALVSPTANIPVTLVSSRS